MGSILRSPSSKALTIFQKALDDAEEQGKAIDWTIFPFNEIEGTDLSAGYEPIWEGHPYEINKPDKISEQ